MENNEKRVTGFRFLGLALLVFCGIMTEGLYAFLIEPAIYGVEMEAFTTTQSLIHWTLTCITWGLIAWGITVLAKKKCNYDLWEKRPQIKPWQWCVVAVMAAFALAYSYHDWQGFKVIKEFISHGALEFVFQYIYYMMETAMFLLIIIFGQVAFEKWFRNDKIPFGGIVVALTWGLGHWFSKGSLTMGIATAILGFCFGSVYLMLNRNVKWSYVALFIMFVM